MPRPSATFRSRLSLVHKSVGVSIKTEAIKCASVRPMPKLYRRRASIIERSSLARATRTCGNRSSRASALARSFSDPRASSAMMKGMDDNLSLFKVPAHFLVAGAQMVDPNRGVGKNQFFPGRRRGVAFNRGIVPASDANLRALSRSMRALRASRSKAVFSATPVNSWAVRTRSSSNATVVLIKLRARIIASNDVIIDALIWPSNTSNHGM